MPRYYIWTIGCQMNKAESEQLGSFFERQGYEVTATADEADIIVLNKELTVLIANGDGTYGRQVYPLARDLHSKTKSLYVTDINGDAQLDVLAALPAGFGTVVTHYYLYTFVGDANRQFTPLPNQDITLSTTAISSFINSC